MWQFFTGLFLLIFGYFTYGCWIESLVAPSDKPTPGVRLKDNVDFIILPHWKNMLIQLLNIAGIGPVIGLILGIKFGPWVFIILPLGNIFAGAVHDYFSGMLSIRNDGANLPRLLKRYLGDRIYPVFSIFLSIVLLLVVAVFINVPAKLLVSPVMLEMNNGFFYAVLIIFAYYIVATLFPIDKIIGRFYPFFGGLLIVASVAIFSSIIWHIIRDPAIMTPNANYPWANQPIIPVLFVTIACGIISGFHATQSPIVARTILHEKQGRQVFYGMMVAEGIIGMIWGAAGLIIYNLFPETHNVSGPIVLGKITDYFLGSFMSKVSIIGVIILAITSGDTALRSLRLSIAEFLHIDQSSLIKRILICLPIFVIVSVLLFWSNQDAKSFNILWNYFAWANQVLATLTLLTASVALYLKCHRYIWVALIPGCFMLFVVLTYIIWHPIPKVVGISLNTTYIISAVMTLLIAGLIYWQARSLEKKKIWKQ